MGIDEPLVSVSFILKLIDAMAEILTVAELKPERKTQRRCRYEARRLEADRVKGICKN